MIIRRGIRRSWNSDLPCGGTGTRGGAGEASPLCFFDGVNGFDGGENYERIMNKLRANLLYMEKLRGYDGCCADEI